MKNLISKWDALTDQQKAAFGDRFITHESNLAAWSKPFSELSESKKRKVIDNLNSVTDTDLNAVIS